MSEVHKYVYSGPVKSFGSIVVKNWYGETMATTAKKAKSNLCYQYKKKHGLTPDAVIDLSGEVVRL